MSYNNQNQYGQQPQYGQPQPQYGQPQYPQYQQYQQQPQYNQYQQQPYPTPVPYGKIEPHAAIQNNNSINQSGHTFVAPKKEDRFKSKGYQDLWALLLWIASLIGFGVVAYIAIKDLRVDLSGGGSASPILAPADIGYLVAATAVVGFVLSLGYFYLMQNFASVLIKVSLVLVVVTNVIFAILLFALTANIILPIIMLVLSAIYAWVFWSWRHRIPFATMMLQTISSITKKYPATLFVSVLGLIAQLAFMVLWVITNIGLFMLQRKQALSDGAQYGLWMYTVFCFYWTAQVIINVVHITVAGLFATYYFRGVSDQNGHIDVPVKNPTAAAFKRSVTTALGSNCYGSLLIAIIQTLKSIAEQARRENHDNPAMAILFCCLQCILSLIQDIMEYFNKYAFAQVAIYGKDYCTAAKDTWELCKSRGIDAIINDSLIGAVLSMGGLFIGLVTGGIGLLVVYVVPTIPKTVTVYIVVGLGGIIIGGVEFGVLASVIDSGVTTTFVCLAEDPQALALTKPDLYREVQRVYPHVALGF